MWGRPGGAMRVAPARPVPVARPPTGVHADDGMLHLAGGASLTRRCRWRRSRPFRRSSSASSSTASRCWALPRPPAPAPPVPTRAARRNDDDTVSSVEGLDAGTVIHLVLSLR